MLERSIRAALQNRLAAFVLASAIGAGGAYAFSNLAIEAFPDPTDTQVQVITLVPGQPTEEVERRVSIPLERELNGLPHLDSARSVSLFGLSSTTLTFDDGIDPQEARHQVTERIGQADLPPGIQPSLGLFYTPIGEVYRYTLDAPAVDAMTLRTLQDWTVRPQLLRVPGVADVVSYGGLVREIHVEPDPARLAAQGVGLDDVFGALKKASQNASGGYVVRGAETLAIRSVGVLATPADVADVRVGFHEGRAVRVADVATVRVGYAPRQGIVTRDGNPDAVEGIVLMRRGENPSAVLEGLRQRIAELNARILPKNVRIDPFYDRADLVHTTLTTVYENLAEGAGLVILVLFLFTFSLRAALVVAAVIPLSLCTSFLYLWARGKSANLLSMGAVDFGIIVDGAVILVEHLFHRVAGPASDGAPIEERIVAAATEVARPTLFSLLIIIAAYVPIFTLQRVEGRIFGPMANTVASALVGAMIVSFTVVPVLAYFALRRGGPAPSSPLDRWTQRAFEPAIDFALENRAAVMVLAGGLVVASAVLLPNLGAEFLPQLNEGALYVTFTLPETMSLGSGAALSGRIKAKLRETPEVVGLMSQLGRPEDGTDASLPNNLEFFVKLAPMSTWRSEMRSLDDFSREMDDRLKAIPGIDYNFSQPIRDNVNENITGQFGEIALKIYGDDLDSLQKLAEQTRDVLAKVRGVADLGVVKSGELPQVAITVDRQALARYDLDMADVQDYLETAMAGHVASEVWDGEKRFDVTVRLPSAARDDVGAIRAILLPLKNGALVPVSAIADVRMGVGRAAITRENGRRYVGVRMNVRNRDMGSFVDEARRQVDAQVPLPAGYERVWGGQFQNQERAMARLRLVIPLSLLMTFLLLFSSFGSVGDSLLVLLSVPCALVGGVAGLAVVGMPMSVSAAVGFIALLGQAVLNAVLVVTAINARIERGEPLESAARNGARDRLRAVLMTALLASLGLLPSALSHAIGSETQRPLAIVVVAGTISAAALSLFVLPVFVCFAATVRERWAARTMAEPEPIVR